MSKRYCPTQFERVNEDVARIIVDDPAKYEGIALVWARLVLKAVAERAAAETAGPLFKGAA